MPQQDIEEGIPIYSSNNIFDKIQKNHGCFKHDDVRYALSNNEPRETTFVKLCAEDIVTNDKSYLKGSGYIYKARNQSPMLDLDQYARELRILGRYINKEKLNILKLL